MRIRLLQNKKYHIPTERIKEADRGAYEAEMLTQRVNAMTDEEYEEYIRKELDEIDNESEEDYMTEEEFWNRFNEHCRLLEKERKNYKNWKNILEIYRNEKVIWNAR